MSGDVAGGVDRPQLQTWRHPSNCCFMEAVVISATTLA